MYVGGCGGGHAGNQDMATETFRLGYSRGRVYRPDPNNHNILRKIRLIISVTDNDSRKVLFMSSRSGYSGYQPGLRAANLNQGRHRVYIRYIYYPGVRFNLDIYLYRRSGY